MKNRVWKQAAWILAAGLLTASAVQAEETEAPETVMEETEAPATEAVTEETAAEDAGALSEDIYDYQIRIDGTVYQFPMTYEEFTANGWEINPDFSDADTELEPNQYDLVYFTKGEAECMTYVINLGLNTQKVAECLVGGIEISQYDWDASAGEVELAKGIRWGESTLEEIQEAYGNATDTYEGDLYTQLTYESDIYSSLELAVYKDSGVLGEITIQNFEEPEGFDPGEVNEEAPAELAEYEAPAELGDDLLSYTAEFDGALYQLPCPVGELLENGWQIDESNTDEVIPARSSGWVGFLKEGYSFHVLARNAADYATVAENCWLENLSAGDYGMEVSMKLPGGLEIGSTEEDLTAALESAGLTAETEDGSSYRTYQIGEDYWNGMTFYVCTDEECSLHTPGSVYKIEMAHEKE